MTERIEVPTRKARFRAAIAGYIEERRLPKEKDKNYDPAKYEYQAWLAGAARRASQIQVVTHVLKASHPDARGSSLRITPEALPQHAEVGSHLLGDGLARDVVGNAAALDVFGLLKKEVDGRRLLDWLEAGDPDLKAALADDETEASALMEAFSAVLREEDSAVSHPLAKQVYWLSGEDPRNDADYHLLQPMFSSSLAQAVHDDIQAARFGDANVAARKAFRDNKPSDVPYREYLGLAFRKIGGTKPHNISQLNSERGGRNYLLASLPPPEWKSRGIRLLNRDTAFGVLLSFRRMRERVTALGAFLALDPDANARTRTHREGLERAIAEQLALFGTAVRTEHSAGWTRAAECVLPLHQQLWLDPDRTLLELRSDPAHPEWEADDETFNREYHRGEWADLVARDFGLWLNAQLRRRGGKLLALAGTEMRHFASTAILDVAWPVPMQRRAGPGGAA